VVDDTTRPPGSEKVSACARNVIPGYDSIDRRQGGKDAFASSEQPEFRRSVAMVTEVFASYVLRRFRTFTARSLMRRRPDVSLAGCLHFSAQFRVMSRGCCNNGVFFSRPAVPTSDASYNEVSNFMSKVRKFFYQTSKVSKIVMLRLSKISIYCFDADISNRIVSYRIGRFIFVFFSTCHARFLFFRVYFAVGYRVILVTKKLVMTRVRSINRLNTGI